MPRDTKEPQSYGSGPDWTTGKTGQGVNDPAAAPPAEHRDFYESSRESETVPHQGGRTSVVQLADTADAQPQTTIASGSADSGTKVSRQEGGAKRDSYFRKRDYE